MSARLSLAVLLLIGVSVQLSKMDPALPPGKDSKSTTTGSGCTGFSTTAGPSGSGSSTTASPSDSGSSTTSDPSDSDSSTTTGSSDSGSSTTTGPNGLTTDQPQLSGSNSFSAEFSMCPNITLSLDSEEGLVIRYYNGDSILGATSNVLLRDLNGQPIFRSKSASKVSSKENFELQLGKPEMLKLTARGIHQRGRPQGSISKSFNAEFSMCPNITLSLDPEKGLVVRYYSGETTLGAGSNVLLRGYDGEPIFQSKSASKVTSKESFELQLGRPEMLKLTSRGIFQLDSSSFVRLG